MSVTKEKLTDKQLRILQVIAGILSAAALNASIYLASPSSTTSQQQGGITDWLFIIVLFVVMFGRRKIETRYNLRLNLFGLVLIDGIVVGIILFAINIFYFVDGAVALNETLKIVIIAAAIIILAVVGILLPLRRYFRRKENGTLPPIRLPEPEETEEEEEEAEDHGPTTLEQQINAMTRELDEGNPSDDTSEDQ